MALPMIKRRRLLGWLAALAGAGLLVVLGWWVFIAGRAIPPRLIFVLPKSHEQWEGFKVDEEAAVKELLLLVFRGAKDRTLVRMENLPTEEQQRLLGPRDQILRIRAARAFSQLKLDAEWWSSPTATPLKLTSGLVTPRKAWTTLSAHPDLGFRNERVEALICEDPAQFWTLLDIQVLRAQTSGLKEASHRITQFHNAHPDQVLANYLDGDIHFRIQHFRPELVQGAQHRAMQYFQSVTRTAPWIAETWNQLAQLQAGMGRHREALDLLKRGLEVRPGSQQLLSGLSYAARSAGLLDIAHRAYLRRLAWVPAELDPIEAENTLLYLGHTDAFERTLEARTGHNQNSLVDFYRGYCLLLRGRQQEAVASFSRTEALHGDFLRFPRLARVFRQAALKEVQPGALSLKEFGSSRSSLQIIDGEFTFKLAEAFALYGDHDGAIDMAATAFGQGFSCARWYQTSPLMQNLQGLPRYQNLVHNVMQRQSRFEAEYKAADFGL